MKQRFFFFAALCAAALVSCTPKEIVVDTPEENAPAVENLIPITITASLDGVKSDMDGAAWTWKSGDKLAVYDGTAKREFTLDPSADGQSVAIFSGSVSSTEGLKAVFPFEAAGAVFGTPAIPSDQSIPSGATIDPDAMIAVANTAEKVSDSEFNFYFTSGISLLRLTPPAGATKVIIHTAAKGETLAGESPAVTVNLADADGSKQFWAAVQPAKYTGIRIFTLKSDSKYYLLKTDAEIDLSTPGKGKKLGSLAAGTEVSVIEDGAGLVSYLSGSPALDGYIVKDIDLSSQTITACSSFANAFDGLFHTISNWTSQAVPFFTVITAGASVKNMTLDSSCSITFPGVLSDYGAVATTNKGTIDNVSVNAVMTVPAISSTSSKDGLFGVLTGVSSGVVSNCVSGSIVNYSGAGLVASNNLYFGGITGRAEGRVENSTFEGSILFTYTDATMTKCLYAAGICGNTSANAAFVNCKNQGTVGIVTPGSGNDCLFACGIVGYCGGTIDECTNEGDVFVYSESAANAADGPLKRACAAGISGYSTKPVTSCTNSGSITLRGGYSSGYAGVGSLSLVSSVAAGIVGLTYNTTVSKCKNTGNVYSILKNIDNASANYNTNTRATIGGIVGNQQGTITDCTNSGKVEAYWVTSAHDAALSQNFVAQGGGICGGSYNSTDKTESSIEGCTNSGRLSFTCDATGSNNAFGGIVGWPGSEPSGGVVAQTGSISGCAFSGELVIDGFGKTRAGGISGNACTIESCSVSGTISIPGKINSGYIGGVVGYEAAGHTVSNTVVDHLTIDYTNDAYMNGTIYGLGGLVGQPQNAAGFEIGSGCSILVTIKSNHCRDIGLIAGRITNTTNTMAYGTADSKLTIKKGCSIVNKHTGNTVSVESEADLAQVISSYKETQDGKINYDYGGFLAGSLNYSTWKNLVTFNLEYSE